ncbi:DDE_3 domain-containing protein [Trichonephila clavipes]|nr:DDE_3 domain-containing protein [Trichonephila clavipes]
MIWAKVSWFSAGPILTLKETITGEKYREIFANQIHPMMQSLFPVSDGVFQDDNAPIHATGLVQLWLNTMINLSIYLGPHSHPTSI